MSPAMRPSSDQLKRGWTTGACATAATRAAFTALLTGEFPDPVEIVLPKGQTPAFALACEGKGEGWAQAGIVKDAGDDPDVTHGALILSTVRPGAPGTGVTFAAGEGVGTVTLPGLPIEPGEPAINPVPRAMMTQTIEDVAKSHSAPVDVIIEISVPEGKELAKKTWNPRLGIKGGLSILGTTGIVNPFSCSAWIHSIHRGIDVARAQGRERVAGATGSTSEAAVKALYDLPDEALLDMGDFAGGMLKYLRKNPVPKVSIAGGFAKLAKLGQGFLDLHSGRSQVDFKWLAERVEQVTGDQALAAKARTSNTALEVLQLVGDRGADIAQEIANAARVTALETLRDAPCEIDIVVVDRQGRILARSADDG
ncbi:MAG: cobalt-precorrin-5B (C(1))-methyltransferase [Rhizobiales bacterium]|nr:cobalt-precorrin-5B (C(1))-methyltransferase [Hyphomicrobiales bacterium]